MSENSSLKDERMCWRQVNCSEFVSETETEHSDCFLCKNQTVVLSNTSDTIFCPTDNGGYFISKFHPNYCDKKHDCNNNMDEKDCSDMKILESMAITFGIVLVGVGLYLMLRYSRILDIHNPNIEVSRTANINTKDAIIDSITLGKLSNIL